VDASEAKVKLVLAIEEIKSEDIGIFGDSNMDISL